MSETEIRYVDRTRIITYQRCPRRRYHEFEYQGRGIVPRSLSIPLAVGSHVHRGAEYLLKVMRQSRPLSNDIDKAVLISTDGYWREVAQRGFDLDENEVAAEVAKEQAALVEALIRLFGMKVIPWLIEDGYQILAVEEECEWQMAPGLVMMGRPDAVMLHQPTGDIHLLSLKTRAAWDSRADKANAHDDQGISETVCYEEQRKALYREHLNWKEADSRVQAVVMPFLLKGERSKNKDTGIYEQKSPLIKGYRRNGPKGWEYAHSWYWTDETGRHGLSKGKHGAWEKFNVWETEGGVKAWMQLLNTGTIQPEAGDPLADSVMIPTPYFRQDADIESWKRQIISQESGVLNDIQECHNDLDLAFPQHRHSCHYPSDCPYVPLCFGPPQMAEDPLSTDRYVWRTPHHEAELVQVQEVQS